MESSERDLQTSAVIAAALKVHRALGCGFLEVVYRLALGIELARCDIPFAREVSFPLAYGGVPLRVSYRADFVCYDALIVEVKALRAIGPSSRRRRSTI